MKVTAQARSRRVDCTLEWMRLIFALRGDFAEHCVFAWVRVLVRVCMCVWALAEVGPYWQSVEVKQLVWTVESQLGFWAWPPPPPSVQWNVPFGFRYSSYAECVSSFQPPLVFNMIILNSLILCWLLYLHFFPPSHCHPHQTSLSVEENSFRSSLFQPQRVQQYKWGQVWVIN